MGEFSERISGRFQGGRCAFGALSLSSLCCLCSLSVILNEVKNLVIRAIVSLLSADPSTTLRYAQDDKGRGFQRVFRNGGVRLARRLCALSVLKMTPLLYWVVLQCFIAAIKTLKATDWSPLVLAPLRASNPNYF